VQRRRAVGHRDRVLDAGALGQRALEAGDQRPLGDSVGSERGVHRGEVVGLDRLVRVGEDRGPNARTAEDRKLVGA